MGISLRTIIEKEKEAQLLICLHRPTRKTTWIFTNPKSLKYNLDKFDLDAEIWELLTTIP